jgi:hypothetical protein
LGWPNAEGFSHPGVYIWAAEDKASTQAIDALVELAQERVTMDEDLLPYRALSKTIMMDHGKKQISGMSTPSELLRPSEEHQKN